MPSPTQYKRFRAELEAGVRNVDGRTAHGKAFTSAALELLEHPRAVERMWRCVDISWRDDASLRRIRQAGFDEGYDQARNDLASLDQTPPSEEDIQQ